MPFGGPDGELGASTRYLSQRYSMPYDVVKGILTDIGTEVSVFTHENCKTLSHMDLKGFYSLPEIVRDTGYIEVPKWRFSFFGKKDKHFCATFRIE